MELRKAKKEDQLLKRRNLDTEQDLLNLWDQNFVPPMSQLSIDEIVEGINSSDETAQMIATQSCRKLLSREKNPPINDIIQGGIVPRCIELLNCDNKYVYVYNEWLMTFIYQCKNNFLISA